MVLLVGFPDIAAHHAFILKTKLKERISMTVYRNEIIKLASYEMPLANHLQLKILAYMCFSYQFLKTFFLLTFIPF